MENTAFDDLDDDSAMIREAYAHYGVAMYHAQVIEHGLVNVIVIHRIAGARAGNDKQAFVTDPWAQEFKKVFAELVKRFKSKLKVDDVTLIAELETCVADRNFLAHRYWRERVEWTVTNAGRQLILDELGPMIDRFKRVDKTLEDFLYAISTDLGFGREDVRRQYEEFERRAREQLPDE